MNMLHHRVHWLALIVLVVSLLLPLAALAQDATPEPTPAEAAPAEEPVVLTVEDAQAEEGPLARAAEWFIGLFQRGGEVFVSLVTGIVPLLIILMTFVNALIALIGVERIERVGEWAARPGLIYYPVRYILLPVVSVFFLTNPMAYTMGRFLPERYKPAFYDSAVSFVHPPLGLFPHVNPGEYFVWGGIAAGLVQRGLGLGDLAIRYLLVGLVVIFIRGIVTERITAIMWSRQDTDSK
jgi:glucitol/sorbitol PTS system EIIC component